MEPMKREPTHPLLPGKQVVVFNLVPAKRPFVEGRGVIVAPIDYIADFYLVRFDDEGDSIRPRLVFPGDWQTESDKILGALRAAWRASLDPAMCSVLPLRP